MPSGFIGRGVGPVAIKRRASGNGLTLVFHDEFTDADATALAAHTPAPVNSIGAAWTSILGGWSISNNKARATSDVAAMLAVISVPTSIAKISCVITFPVGTSTRIRGVSIGGLGDVLVGYRQSDNTFCESGGQTIPWDGGGLTNRTLEIVIAGSSITATISAMSITWTQALSFPLAIGMIARYSDERFDDFKVWQ